MSVARMLLRDEVYATLRDWIVSGELRSGERLRVRELAGQLGVSRTPLREALQRLEDEGLIEASASRWTRVAVVDLDQASRVYAIVAALERLAVGAGKFSDTELDALRAANARLSAALAEEDAHGAYVADREFHDGIVRHAENVELERIVTELRVKTRLVEHALFGGFSAAASSVVEHDAILAALAAGKSEQAAEAIGLNHFHALERLTSSDTASSAGSPRAVAGVVTPIAKRRDVRRSAAKAQPGKPKTG